ncbi:MAG: hypothetical protein JWN14_4992 [Chthonomonadales bacterium]|nr:hypothetical protein [Chthonomonadales bacterium]
MRQSTVRFGLAMSMLVLPLLKASALTVQIQLTPSNKTEQKFAFQVTNEDRDGMKQFGVTVTAKKEKLSPGLLARLHLSDGKTDIAMVPVEETREGDKVTYWFRVAPNLMSKTRFEFDLLNGKETKEADGKKHFIAFPGTIEYWFYVGDFATQKEFALRTRSTPTQVHKKRG